MCGIAGFIKFNSNANQDHSRTITAMLDKIVHRGPDDSGVWINEANNVVLGHRRLSILDLSIAGNQPMASHDQRYHIIFNGEIYNHLDLRAELHKSAAITWRSNSDTETLLECISIWGVKATLKQLIGMFAFALYDEIEQKIILARDRIGEKPLYYGWCNNQFNSDFIFGSDLQSFKCHPDFTSPIDRNALALYFRHNYIPAPYTIYNSVQKLLPGSYVELSVSDKKIDVLTYWSFDEVVASGKKNLYLGSFEEATIELDSILKKVVKGQMLSDVPLGAFLSGGIDSSTIVALMQTQSASKVKTFSIGFDIDEFNESVYARKVANHLGTDHTECIITQKEALDIVPQLSNIFSEPFSDSSQIPTYLVSKIAKEKVTVSLSGDAGDEIFGGYNRYLYTQRIFSLVKKAPLPLRNLCAQIIRTLPPEKWNNLGFLTSIKNIGEKLYKVANVMSTSDAMDFYRKVISHTDSPDTFLVNGKEPYSQVLGNRSFNALGFLNDVEKMMAIDTLTYLPDDILVKVDRSSMAVSLESRVPFLDHRVIEFAWTLPHEYKISKGVSKRILKSVLYQYVPKEIMERPKMGFGIPINPWLRGPLRDWANDLLNESVLKNDQFLDVAHVRKILDDHMQNKSDNGYMLWNILMFQSWLNGNNK